MLYARKLKTILQSSQVYLSLCQFQSNALMFGLWISFLHYQVVKVTILFLLVLTSSPSLCGLIPCFKGKGALSAPECANLFFSNIVRLFGIPKMVLHDYNSRFTSNFWKALMGIVRILKYFLQMHLLSIDRWLG